MIPVSRSITIASAVSLIVILMVAFSTSALPSFELSLYASYPAYLSLILIGLLRPYEAYLVALVLLPFDLTFPVPHSITAAPSSYLVSAALLGILVRPDSTTTLVKAAIRNRVAAAVVALVVLAALSGLATSAVRETEIGFKLVFAEFLGLLSMTFFIIVPVCLLKSKTEIEAALGAVTLTAGTVIVGGIIGGYTTLTCVPGLDQPWLFNSAGHRVSGFAADPNRLGIYAMAALGIVILSNPRQVSFALKALGVVLISAIVVVSGSRTGIISGIAMISFLLTISLIFRSISIAIMASLAGIIIVTGTLFLWPNLPCPGTPLANAVAFAERNDEQRYLRRQLAGENAPVEQVSGIETMRQTLDLDDARRGLWRQALEQSVELLPFGGGLASASTYLSNNWSAHNTAITILLEMGLLGLTALIVGLTTGLVAAAQIVRTANITLNLRPIGIALAAIVCGLGAITHDLLRAEFLWGMFGLLLTLGFLPSTRKNLNSSRGSSSARAQRVAKSAT